MAHVRGLWLPGCLALATLFGLVHSQHGKGAWNLGQTDRQGYGPMEMAPQMGLSPWDPA